MKPVEFKGHNVVFGRHQPEYLLLPGWLNRNHSKREVITCWKLSLIERLHVLFTGKMWFSVLTFGMNLQPQRPCVEYPFEKKR